jgi:putative effector of murein hydrolase LrgA (UPF0299 family)
MYLHQYIDRQDMAEILLKVVLSTITVTLITPTMVDINVTAMTTPKLYGKPTACPHH